MPNKLQRAFGSRILELRRDAKMTQEFLSGKTGISVKHISLLENGHSEVCLLTMEKLAKAFGVSIPELMTFN